MLEPLKATRPPRSHYLVLGDAPIEFEQDDKISLKAEIRKWQTEYGEQPFPIIDQHRPTFVGFLGLKGIWQVIRFTDDQILDLCREWPDAAVRGTKGRQSSPPPPCPAKNAGKGKIHATS